MNRLLLAFGFLIAWASNCSAQYAVNCPTYDTVAFNNTLTGVAVISDCQMNTGVTGGILAIATGEITCGADSDYAATMYATSLDYSKGANFNGSISAGVLTVTSMVTPSQFLIQAGQILYDNLSGAGIPNSFNGSTLTVTGQLTGATGGVGTYSVSSALVTVASETMWSLTAVGPLPSRLQIQHGPLEQLACRGGTSQFVTLIGRVRPSDFFPNLNLHIILTLTAENIGSNNPQSASWKNGQITMIAIGAKVGGKGQIVQ